MHELDNPLVGRRKLTQSVLQVTEMLGMYQAELARILGLQCGDIGELAAGKCVLEPDTCAWQQAVLFIRLYESLYRQHAGDGVAMRHWLRRDNTELKGVPLMLMVDDGHLAQVLEIANQAVPQ